MYWHWQNLNELRTPVGEGQRVGWPWAGRAWFYWGSEDRFPDPYVGIEWALFGHARQAGLAFSVSQGDGPEVTVGIKVPWFVNVWFKVAGPGPVKAMVRWLVGNGYDDRDISISWFDGMLLWKLWTDPWSWSCETPRWRDGSFVPVDWLFGRTKHEELALRTVDVNVPMPERTYRATVVLLEEVWRRPRWPGAWYRVPSANVELHEPIPHPGKGTTSYNCGPDALHSIRTRDCHTVAEATAAVVEAVLDKRERYPL